MRPCSASWAPLLLGLLCLLSRTVQSVERHYYIAAVHIDWSYTAQDGHSSGPVYKKVVFREYDAGFKQAKAHPPWLGLLGPTLRGQVGDVIVVTFKNMADRAYSIHPHGIAYGKQSEGSLYFDNTSLFEKEDDQVLPGEEHTYYWEVTPEVSPKQEDPPCLTYNYISHYDIVRDYNSGLIGTILVCKEGSLSDTGEQIHFSQEYALLFSVFNESKSWYTTESAPPSDQVKHTINGYSNGTIPGLSVCAHTAVSWHLLGMSSQPEVFSVHFNGQVLLHMGHRVSSVGLVSGTATSANMTASNPGRWLLSSLVSRHVEAGMHGYLTVEACEGIAAPTRKLTIQQRRQSQEWTYYIAAEETVWDYAPHMPDYIDSEYRMKYLRSGPDRIGRRYKKAVFTQYTDERFAVRAENKQRKMETGLLGPVIRAQIRDVVKVVFKNMASRPYSIYPHGLTIKKTQEGASYPAGGNQSNAVQPGQSHTYVWEVLEENEPSASDSRCLTRMYHSAVDTPRDIASGLVGPLLICKSQSLNKKNVQLKADKEQQAALAVFDENKSWYIEDNIRSFCSSPSKVNRDDPEFYKSNVMHSINGYVYDSGQVLGFCNGEIVTWHMSSVGEQDHIQTATWYGHSFELNDRTENILTLFPMTGETITMNMDNIGHWLMSSLNSYGAKKGVRLKFKDLECYRDYYYDDTGKTDAEEGFSVNIWQPEDIEEIREEEKRAREEEKKKKNAKEPEKLDEFTALYAAELGFDVRSLKNKSQGDDVELLDLAFLDYADEVNPAGNTTKNQSLSSSAISQNHTFPGPGSKKVPTNSSLAEGAIGDVNITTSNVSTTLSNDAEPKVTGAQAVVLALETNITGEITLTVKSVANETSLGRLNGSSEEALREHTPDPADISRTQNTKAKVSEERTAGASSFTYSIPLSEPSSNSTLVEMDHTDKEDFVLLDSSSVSVEIHAGSENKMVAADHQGHTEAGLAHNVSSAHTFPDEHQKTFLASEGGISNAENTECNSSCPKMFNVTGPGVEIQNINVTNSNVTVNNISNSTEQINSTLFVGATSLPGSNGTDYTTLRSQALPKLQSDNETSPETVASATQDEEVLDGGTKVPSYEHRNISEEISSEEKDGPSIIFGGNVALSPDLPPGLTNLTNLSSSNVSREAGPFEDPHEGNISLKDLGSFSGSEHDLHNNSNQNASRSREEVVIYLKNNSKEAILTVSLDQKEHWAYEGGHRLVPMEIPGNMTKYTKDEPKAAAGESNVEQEKKPKGKKRKWPAMTQNLKTRKKKVYKAQPSSELSPRGRRPPAFSPRGSRPISSEEDLSTKSIVIGVPRRDFNDYELYVPNTSEDSNVNIPEDNPGDDYEYVDYKDPYSQLTDIKDMDDATKYFLKMAGDNVKAYFIAAEEVQWDYAGYGQRRQERTNINDKPTQFYKVVFRSYLDSSFTTPENRGEVDEHLGLLGPVLKAEVDQTIMVVFKNMASRPYSMHAHGVSYSKQMEGLKYDDDSPHWYKLDNEVQPEDTYTYIWKMDPKFGPKADDSDCRTWAYHSGVNPEKDINSGLIGPLLVCRKGTLEMDQESANIRDFVLLFMTFDETKSWYYERNMEMIQRKHRRAAVDPEFTKNIHFPAINGIIFSLKGLRMYTNHLVRWHLINMGSPKDFHSIHFHGQTFLDKQTKDYRQGVFPLLPGGFADLEMRPSKPGLWQLETEVGDLQQRGMQTLFLVIDDACNHPLGLVSQSVKNNQVTASHYTGEWKPHLARLQNSGKYNAWSTDQEAGSWIQVDFQRPVVISKVATQGAKQLFTSHYVEKYTISYSTDRRKWTVYKGISNRKTFTGNQNYHEVKENTFYPPLIGRFVRLIPTQSYNRPTVRFEYYGCELDGCSVPLGMENGRISDLQITASSTASSWYAGPWQPWFARLNKQGAVNAWQAKTTNMQQWLQVELKEVKKITGIVTQGAKSLGTEMFVTEYTIEYSKDGTTWIKYKEDEDDYDQKIFPGNADNNGHAKNYIYPPIFSRFIRIVPRRWQKTITMRIELLGCDFE